MSPGDPLAVAARAARGFQVFQCQECADSIQHALRAAGQPGEVIEIRDAGGRDFIVCLSYDGGHGTITQNGRHVGVRSGDVMFDNLHPDGVSFDQWLSDFDSMGGVIVYSTLAF